MNRTIDHCTACGVSLRQQAQFCVECGTPRPATAARTAPVIRPTVLLRLGADVEHRPASLTTAAIARLARADR